jgi:hypothetical protein
VADGYWQPGGESGIWIYYFPAQLYVQIDNYGAGLASSVGLPVQGQGWDALNYIEIHVQSSPTYPIQWYVDYVSTSPNLRWDSNAIPGAEKTVYAFDFDLASGFQMGSRLTIPNIPAPAGAESLQVEVKFGYVPPRRIDDHAPVVVGVSADPQQVFLHATPTLLANVSDVDWGNSPIQSAHYYLDGHGPFAMAPEDGTLDSAAEMMVAVLPPLTTVGFYTVCVQARDAKGNQNGLTSEENNGSNPCTVVYVDYAMEGFYAPLSNETVNVVKPGQTVPVKWRLVDTHGAPVSDPASFEGLYSYQINCSTVSGKIIDVVEEEAAGGAGLQYLGDGSWQFNWKTAKTYDGTCRTMFIAWNSTFISPQVDFKFVK